MKTNTISKYNMLFLYSADCTFLMEIIKGKADKANAIIMPYPYLEDCKNEYNPKYTNAIIDILYISCLTYRDPG